MKKLALPIRFGVAISGSLIAFFLILSLFNQHTSPIYSLFNGVITGFGIYEVIKVYKLKEGRQFNYTNGFKTGLITGFVATLIFTVFFALYATEFDTDFYNKLMDTVGFDVSIGMIIFMVGLMGIVTTVILTFTFMQLFKPSRNVV